MSFPCIDCGSEVRPRQHAVACDVCDRWQHRTCNTGISQTIYRDAVKASEPIHFVCAPCLRRELNDEPRQTNPEIEQEQTIPDSTIPDNTIPEPEATFSPALESTRTEDLPIEPPIVDVPERFQESTILEPPPAEISNLQPEEDSIVYNIVQGASQRLGSKLVDNRGYSYTVKRKTSNKVDWRCTKRRKTCQCPATVRQCGDEFTEGSHNHIHPRQAGALTLATVVAEIKKAATEEMFAPASQLVNNAVLNIDDATAPCPSMPKPTSLHRMANRMRQATRPKDPDNLEFEVDEAYVNSLQEGFLKRRQRKVYANMQRKLFSAWDNYLEGHITLRKLHRTCASLATPIQ